MAKNDLEWESYCKKHGFKPFPIDEETIDLDSGLIDELVDAFRNGSYDRSFPLVIATSDDPTVHGEVVDGKHRIVACFRLFKRGVRVSPFPSKVDEDIPDLDTLKLRIAHYIQRSRSKDAKFARKLIKRNVKEVMESRYDTYGEKLPEEIVKMGFASTTIINELMDEIKEKREKKGRNFTGAKKSNNLSFDVGASTDWGVSKRFPNEDINAKPGETDGITSYRECPCGCNPPKQLVIRTDIQGAVIDIKRAEVVSSG